MTIKKNLIANYVGTFWAALVSFAFVPFYLDFIGVEGYGLVGFFLMLTATLSILDGGLGAAASRESARYSASDELQRREIVDVLHAMEVLFWGISCVVGSMIAITAPLLVDYWLNVAPETREATIVAIRWMALAILVQFPTSFYVGCLNGLQKQVALNCLNIIGSTIRSIGAVLILWLISPSVEAFFAWNAISGLGMLIAYRVVFYNGVSESKNKVQFCLYSLRRVKHFIAGVGIINVLALLLTQLDKLILSKILSLQDFGYYSLAWTLGTLVYRLTGPIFNAYYPKITQEVELGNKSVIMATYQKSCVIMSIAVVPFSLWIAVFSKEILFLWARNPEISNAASGALSVIAIGTMCNAFMHMPYALQLAYSHTRLALWQNVLTLIFIAPLTWILATRYGLTAAALPWLLVNLSYVLISPFLMYRQLSLSGLRFWYLGIVLGPLLISSVFMAVSLFLWIPDFAHQLQLILVLTLILALAFFATLYFSKVLILRYS